MDTLDDVVIPYDDLPRFLHVSASGHNPNLVIDNLKSVSIAIFSHTPAT